MTLIFEAGLFKHSEELNTAFLQPLGRTPDNDDELKQNFSATEISFQIASTIKILSNNVVKTFKRCTESCSESSNEDSMSTSQEELLPKLVPCDRSKRIGEKWTTSSEVLQLLKTVPKSCVKTLKRCTEAGESSDEDSGPRQFEPCDRSKRKEKGWEMSSKVRALLRSIPKRWMGPLNSEL
eukprot:GHVP01010111.1.p1 GENE.GHVP01010111.1~~GHVP01010111.1.p1  ORF type:complete len:181 (+),score=26.54 GHVP01010111.1:57-599(+)